MRKTILAIVLAGLCHGASAAWQLTGTDAGVTFYADPATLAVKDGRTTLWVLDDYEKSQSDGALSVKSQVEYDCAARRFRVLFASRHAQRMAREEMPVTEDARSAWQPAAGRRDAEWRIACRRGAR